MSNLLETVIDKSDKALQRQGKIAIAGIEINIILTVDEQGKVLEIDWGEPDTSSQYAVEWLVNEHQESVTNDGQRVDYDLVCDELSIVDLKVMTDSVTIALSNGAEVVFTYESLLLNSDQKIKTTLSACVPASTDVESPKSTVLGTHQPLPRFDYETLTNSPTLRSEYLQTLRQYGVVLVTGAPVDTKQPLKDDAIRKLCEVTGGLQANHYGETITQTLNVRLENEDDTYQSITGKDVVAEYGHPVYSNARLPLHADFSFYDSVPGIALLECVEYDKIELAGGTVFIDGIQIVNEFKSVHPQSYRTLCELPIVFSSDRRLNPEKPVFYRVQKPIFSLNYFGELEQIRWEQTNYHLPNLEPHNTRRLRKALSDFRNFCTAIEDKGEMGHLVQWNPGDTVVWNNRRMLHFRPEYTAAPDAKRSHILAYANYIDFISLSETLVAH